MEAPACAFVIMGITGDLAARKLLPALYALHLEGKLHPDTKIIGYARSSRSAGELRAELGESVRAHAESFSETAWDTLAGRVSYVQGDYGDPAGYARLARALADAGPASRLFYTATPPSTYGNIFRGLMKAGLNGNPGGGFTRL